MLEFIDEMLRISLYVRRVEEDRLSRFQKPFGRRVFGTKGVFIEPIEVRPSENALFLNNKVHNRVDLFG